MQESDGLSQKELLGEVLIKRNLVTEQQLNQALGVQKVEGGFIGQILVRLGFIEDKDLVAALVVQCNFPYIAVDKYEIDKSILQLISRETACQYQIIPLDRVGNVLSVVMVNPLDQGVKAELHRITNFQIAPFIATKMEIEKAIGRWYIEGGQA